MKKKLVFLCIITIILIVTLITIIVVYYCNHNRVFLNGYLWVDGTKIKNQFGQEFRLKGLSSHGIQWEDERLLNFDNLKILKDEWNINVFRIAMYTEENGYIQNKQQMKEKLFLIADMCIDLDIYVIIDWHILSDNNPNQYKQDSIEFFDEVSKKYSKNPNVIYEICNEPNGKEVTWINEIVPYAKDVIDVIRKNSPKSLIIVGTPNWSRNILEATYNTLPYENILYAFHFYSGTHGETYRSNVEFAIKKELPIIVSEWGTSTAENAIKFYEEESKIWMNFLNKNNLSWINWAFSNKDEATSILEKDKFELKDENLTQSGKFIKGNLTK